VKEADCIAKAQDGSVEAFTRLLEEHQGRVRAFLARFVGDAFLADDLAQDTFFAAYRSLRDYDPSEAPLGTWLLGIARHRALSHLRAEARRHARESDALDATMARCWAEHLESCGAALLDREDRRITALEECLESLPPRSSSLVTEHYYRGVKAAELAGRLGRTESLVRTTLLRVRQALRRCVEGRLSLERTS
jgi:RNA polymerase sigma-70 factor (ECF subfamily)